MNESTQSFKEWGQEISEKLAAAGFEKTGDSGTIYFSVPKSRHWFDRMCGVYGAETPPERTTIAAFFIGSALALGGLVYVLSLYVSAHG